MTNDTIFYYYDGRVHAICDSLYDGIGGLSWNLSPNSKPGWAVTIYMTLSENVTENLSQVKLFLVVPIWWIRWFWVV
jgi:hypothetical protein